MEIGGILTLNLASGEYLFKGYLFKGYRCFTIPSCARFAGVFMNYRDYEDFIQHRMRMSHVYQPVMLMTLLQGEGKASTTKIAKAILDHDESQIEYYEKIVGNMVGRVLRSHGLVKKEGSEYILCLDEKLTKTQAAHLVELCNEKLTQYEAKRGAKFFSCLCGQ
jgi:hypothetical protein